MADNQSYRLLEEYRSLTADQKGKVYDLGAFKTLVAQIRLISDGTAGTIELQHAAVDEDNAYKRLGTAVSLTATGENDIQNHTNFLRFVRWSADGAVEGTPSVIIDIIAKEY